MMPRVVAAETLDGLAENDPAAMRSRRDLQRVHRMMGTRAMVTQALRRMTTARTTHSPLRILELGAGDGSLMLGVARALKGACPRVELMLLDRQALLDCATVARYADVGWTAVSQVMDVFVWAASDEAPRPGRSASACWDIIVSNLFLHHFEGAPLASLLAAIESRTERFFACEPRRAPLALVGSHLIGAIGANSVTRQDAVLSVHAGFRDQEISALWPTRAAAWTLNEYSAGLFSHCFQAERIEIDGATQP